MISVFQRGSRMDSMSALRFGNENWPKSPAVLSGLSNRFLSYYRGWCARGVLSQLMPSEWEQVRLRCIALEFLKGKREFCGYEGKWHGDYISVSSLNSRGVTSATQYREASGKLNTKRKSIKEQHAVGDFVANGLRLNDKGKFYERTLTISEGGIFKMDPNKKFKVLGKKRGGSSTAAGVWGLDQVRSINLHSDPVSSLIGIEFSSGGSNLVFAIEKPASAVEAMVYLQKLRMQVGLKTVPVQVGTSVNIVLGKKQTAISLLKTSGQNVTFNKTSGNNYQLIVSEN